MTAINQPLIATLRRTPTEDTFCECAMRRDLWDDDVEQLQLEYNEELSAVLLQLLIVHSLYQYIETEN